MAAEIKDLKNNLLSKGYIKIEHIEQLLKSIMGDCLAIVDENIKLKESL
jgi:hypothetical protein